MWTGTQLQRGAWRGRATASGKRRAEGAEEGGSLKAVEDLGVVVAVAVALTFCQPGIDGIGNLEPCCDMCIHIPVYT